MGLYTCKMYPGSKFYLQLDAETFASWGIDMLKLDCCYAGGPTDLEAGKQCQLIDRKFSCDCPCFSCLL